MIALFFWKISAVGKNDYTDNHKYFHILEQYSSKPYREEKYHDISFTFLKCSPSQIPYASLSVNKTFELFSKCYF